MAAHEAFHDVHAKILRSSPRRTMFSESKRVFEALLALSRAGIVVAT